jgi:hypothetical protein
MALGRMPMLPVQRAYYSSQTVVDYSIIGLMIICDLAAGINLLSLRKRAATLFAVGLALGIVLRVRLRMSCFEG